MKKIAKLLFLTLVLSLAAFALVACGGSDLELSAPANVRYDGSTIKWDAVENAAKYTIQINDGQEYTVSGTQYPYASNGTTFSVKVIAVSDTKKIVKSSESVMQFSALPSVAEIRITNEGRLEWDPVDGATAYLVKVGSTETETTDTTYANLPVGTNSVNVRPIVKGDNSYYSYYTKTSKTITICGTVDKDKITYKEGVLSWNYITGAKGYEVIVNGNMLAENNISTSIDYDPQNLDFEVVIKAIGNHSTSFDGAASDVKKFVFLDTITNVNVEDGIVKWDEIAGADGYKLKLNGVVQKQTLTKCEYAGLAENISTDIQIMPISSDTSYFSDWSASKSVFILKVPVVKWNEAYDLDGEEISSIIWDGVNNAAGYEVKLTTPNNPDLPVITTYGETQRFFQEAYLEVGTYTVQVKALAPTENSGIYDGAYSAPITITRLPAPKPVSKNYITSIPGALSEGFTVTFENVAGASKYQLYKDNAPVLQSTTPQFHVNNVADTATIEEQTINYKIQSVGHVETKNNKTSVYLSSLTDKSLDFVITVLSVPTNPTMSGFKLFYDEVNKSSGYVVDVGGQSFTSNGFEYDLSTLSAGNYVVKVCAKGDGAQVLASNYSTPITVKRLAAPTNIKIVTSDVDEGKLSFTGVDNATGYEIVFNNDGNAIKAETITNMSQYITEQGTTVYMLSSANQYIGTTYYMTSMPSPTKSFIKLKAPTFPNVAFSGSQLIWKAPANINTAVYTPTYEVYYPNGTTTYNGEKNGTTMNISDLPGGATYTFYVKAIGNGTDFINSEKSVPVTIYKLAEPEITIANNQYTWSGVSSAVSYVVYIDGKEAHKVLHTQGSTYSFTPKFTELKEYKVEIQAIGDGGYTSINSEKKLLLQKVDQLTTPEFKIEYSEAQYTDTGKIKVTITTESAYATGYCYNIAKNSQIVNSTTYEFCPNNTGTYIVSVYAVGGGFDEEGVYYLDSQTKGGNNNYRIILLGQSNPDSYVVNGDGMLKWASVSDAVSYKIEISVNGGEFETYNKATAGLQIPGYSLSNRYVIRIQAVGNGNNIVSSTVGEKTIEAAIIN